VELLDVTVPVPMPNRNLVLATLPEPYLASSPARLPDGRVVFIRIDPRDVTDTAIGEMFVLAPDGSMTSTGITGVRALEALAGQIVYEEGGASGVTDLIVTDLAHPPFNLTNTPFISEHLGWSD
jgi:hypothetical protein